jgi:hypothetical protein
VVVERVNGQPTVKLLGGRSCALSRGCTPCSVRCAGPSGIRAGQRLEPSCVKDQNMAAAQREHSFLGKGAIRSETGWII